jgi:threonyl-tRNA synthetase
LPLLLLFIDENGGKQRPYIIHRTSIGCYERTLALLIEKYKGNMPLWLSPEQVRVISLTDRTEDAVKSLTEKLKSLGIRATFDVRNEKVGYKIREAQLEKIPYMVIIGDKEVEASKIAVRSRAKGDLGLFSESDFIALIQKEIAEKINN